MKYLKYIVVFLLFSTSVQAGFVDGNELVSNMREFKSAENKVAGTDFVVAAKYWNYVLGVTDTLEYNGIICTPSNTNIRQISWVVAKYLDNNPDKWNAPAYTLVSAALKSAFPCQK